MIKTLRKLLSKTYVAECGHKTKLKGTVRAFGEETETSMRIHNGKVVTHCHECLGKMAIQCAWCGKPIFIGDPITLYSPQDKSHKFPDHAVFQDKEKPQVVGCLRMSCADTGADRAGFWYPPGRVHRIPSVYELMANPGVEAAIVSDVSDPNSKTEIIR